MNAYLENRKERMETARKPSTDGSHPRRAQADGVRNKAFLLRDRRVAHRARHLDETVDAA